VKRLEKIYSQLLCETIVFWKVFLEEYTIEVNSPGSVAMDLRCHLQKNVILLVPKKPYQSFLLFDQTYKL